MTPIVYNSRPQIAIAGQANDGLRAGVLSVLVEETTEGMFRAECCFYNYGLRRRGTGYLYLGRDTLEFGNDLAITLGPGDTARQIFVGRISGIEAEYPQSGTGQIIVMAEDRLQSLRLARRTRVFSDVSDADVFSRIASDHGLTAQVDLDGPTHKLLAQVNQSDLAFLRERARCIDGELWVQGTTLYARSRPDRDGGVVNLIYGGQLMAFTVRADLAHQCTEMGVGGWDVAAKGAIEETADESALGAELGDDTGGASILSEAFGDRKERLVHTTPVTSQEARTLAQAAYRARARRFVTGSGVAEGNPLIKVGAVVNLSGLGSLFDGRYYVVRARHTYDETRGYRTEFDVERAGLGPPDRG